MLAIEVLHSVELRHALQRTVETIIPTVIGTMQDGSLAARFRNHRSGMVTAYVVEPSQYAISTTHNHNWFASHVYRNELSGRRHLFQASDHLPCLAEDRRALKFGNARIDVPWCGNGRCFG